MRSSAQPRGRIGLSKDDVKNCGLRPVVGLLMAKNHFRIAKRTEKGEGPSGGRENWPLETHYLLWTNASLHAGKTGGKAGRGKQTGQNAGDILYGCKA